MGSPYGVQPLVQVVAVINLDVLHGPARDSVAVDGLDALDLNVSPDWITGAHPELRLTVVDGETVFSPQSDHFVFASNPYLLLPSLSIHSEGHQGDRQVTKSAATENAEQVARIVRFVFYLGQEIANADRRPQWNAGYRQMMLERKMAP
jgi:hypothetical protein